MRTKRRNSRKGGGCTTTYSTNDYESADDLMQEIWSDFKRSSIWDEYQKDGYAKIPTYEKVLEFVQGHCQRNHADHKPDMFDSDYKEFKINSIAKIIHANTSKLSKQFEPKILPKVYPEDILKGDNVATLGGRRKRKKSKKIKSKK